MLKKKGKKKKLSQKPRGNRISYLYDGTGNPCAGQRSGRLPPKFVESPFKLSKVGNFGLTLPTGSAWIERERERENGRKGKKIFQAFLGSCADREPPKTR